LEIKAPSVDSMGLNEKLLEEILGPEAHKKDGDILVVYREDVGKGSS
jgi:hypothetical protein